VQLIVKHERKYSREYQAGILKEVVDAVLKSSTIKHLLKKRALVVLAAGDDIQVRVTASLDRKVSDASINDCGKKGFHVVVPPLVNWIEPCPLKYEAIPRWLEFAFEQNLKQDGIRLLIDLSSDHVQMSDLLELLDKFGPALSRTNNAKTDVAICEGFFECKTLGDFLCMSGKIDIKAVIAWLLRERIFDGVDFSRVPFDDWPWPVTSRNAVRDSMLFSVNKTS